MTARFFAVSSLLLLALVVNLVLLVMEKVPEPVGEQTTVKLEDPLLRKKFNAGTRRSNLEDYGLPPDVIDDVVARIEKLEVEDRRNAEQKSLFLESIQKHAEFAGVLCPNEELPQRYSATSFLIEGEGTARKTVDYKKLRQTIDIKLWYDVGTVRGVYDQLELTKGRPDDATALGIAAILLGQEDDVITGSGDWSGGLFGRPSIDSALRRNPGLRDELVEYFALMHLMTEIANDPRSEFCGGRRAKPEEGKE